MSRSARARRASKAATADTPGASSDGAASRAGGTQASDERLIPPKGGAIVRMYRIGHGDCFLIAFDGDDKPIYVLIDCGYKPGSPGKIEPPTKPADVVANIKAATGGEIDVLVITHEHQDHVNAITERNFAGLKIAQAWFAWTEDPSDALANHLRARFDDQLQALLGLRRQIALAANTDESLVARRTRIDALLSFEIGGEVDPDFDAASPSGAGMLGADFAAGGWTNKDSISLVKQRASEGRGITYLRPHEPVRTLTGTTNVRVLVLGPPPARRRCWTASTRRAARSSGWAPTRTELHIDRPTDPCPRSIPATCSGSAATSTRSGSTTSDTETPSPGSTMSACTRPISPPKTALPGLPCATTKSFRNGKNPKSQPTPTGDASIGNGRNRPSNWRST